MSDADLVLFDVFETIGTEQARSRADRFTDFQVYPAAVGLLRELGRRARIGVVSLDPDVPVDRLRERLRSGGLVPPVEPDRVKVAREGEGDPFRRILHEIDQDPDRAVFVSLDARQRARALAAGMRVAPHPALAPAVLAGQPLQLARFSGGEPDGLAPLIREATRLALVPVLEEGEPEPALYAIGARPALREAAPFAGVEELGEPGLVDDTTLALLQITPEQVAADASLGAFIESLERAELPLLRETPAGWLVALPSDRSPELLHPPPAGAAHGHTRILLPSVAPLAAREQRVSLSPRPPTEDERKVLGRLDEDAIQTRLKELDAIVSDGGLEEPQP